MKLDGECPCPQGQRAASKWCKHMVAVELWKRAQARLHAVNGDQSRNGDSRNGNGKPAPTPPPEPEPIPAIADDCARHWTDHEPPVVWHVEFVIDNMKHGVTVRCDDLQEAKAQVKEITALVKKAQTSETPAQVEDVPYCDVHDVYFERHSNAKGSWHSHKTADGWCRYKGGKA